MTSLHALEVTRAPALTRRALEMPASPIRKLAPLAEAAKLIGMENEVGRIAPGFSADLIAVDGDPLQDVRILEDVDYVMVRGRTID